MSLPTLRLVTLAKVCAFTPSIAFALLLATVTLPTTVHAWCQSANVQSPRGSCMQRCPEPSDAGDGTFVWLAWDDRDLTWQLERGGSRDAPREVVIAIVDRSFFRWTNVTCGEHALDFAVSFDPSPSDEMVAVHTLLGPNENQVLFDDAWAAHDHDPSAFALATVHYSPSTGRIRGADLELNEEHWRFTTCPPAGCVDGQVDLENVVTHEIGHFFGLAHTPNDAEATMWACSAPGDVHMRDLEEDDVAGLCALYGGRVTGGCGCVAPGARDPHSDEAAALVLVGLIAVGAHRLRRRR